MCGYFSVASARVPNLVPLLFPTRISGAVAPWLVAALGHGTSETSRNILAGPPLAWKGWLLLGKIWLFFLGNVLAINNQQEQPIRPEA